MLNIINDIVSISKIEAGLMKLNNHQTNINKQLDFIHKFFKPQTDSKEISLVVDGKLSGDAAFIKSDSEKIYSVLTNLVKNAIKHTDKGTITLGCVPKIKNEKSVLISYRYPATALKSYPHENPTYPHPQKARNRAPWPLCKRWV